MQTRESADTSSIELANGSDDIALEIVDGGFMENVTIRDITMKRGIFVPLCVRIHNRNRRANGHDSHLRNMVIENVKMECPSVSWYPCSVTGASGLHPSEITVRNCHFKMCACHASEQLRNEPVPEGANAYPTGSMFRVITPTYDAYVRHADDVKFESVRFELVGGHDARQVIYREP